MAEILVEPIVDKLLSQVISLVADEINLAIGVKRQLKKLRKTFEMIRDLLDDAEKRRVSDKAVNRWLKELEDIAFEAEDVLDDVAYEVLRRKVMIQNKLKNKASNFFSRSNPILFRLKMAHKVKDINLRLSDLKNEANSFGLTVQYAVAAAAAAAAPPPLVRESRETHSYVDVSQVVGREVEISDMVEMLTAASSNQEALSVIPVVGMAGLGKTTFSQCICQNEKVKKHFDDVIMWVCVSDDFDDNGILKKMHESLNKSKCDMTSLDALFGKLKDAVGDRKFLLVLDDVWNEDPAKWNRLRGSLTAINNKLGSRIIVTTRSDNVASIMETIPRFQLGRLPYEICLTIFEQRAFASGGAVRTPELVSIGEQIVRKCNGLPLAVAASGGMMWRKKDKEEWLSILDSKIWDESGILPAIRLSFDHLPSAAIKQCFAYCSIFPKDSIMEKDDLIQLWMGQGLLQPPPGSTLEMEDVGDQHIQTLLWNNLLQDAERDEWNNIQSFKMHDVVHDLAQYVSNARCFTVEASKRNNLSDFRHLNLDYPIDTPNDDIQLDSSKLRTLFFNGGANFGTLMNSKSLRCLALDSKGTEELPTSIGKLKHLRYLNLSRIHFKELPYSVTDLFHLQTLRLRDVDLGRGVAKDFKKLVSLRHLCIDERPAYDQMPRGIGQLTSLQTLPFFPVGRENGQRIEELGSLCNLRGKLVISELQNVRGKEEAKRANLLGKSKILELSLNWSVHGEGETKNDEEVLEGLQPHHNLKRLAIENYRGEIIPEWIMMRRGISTLENLVDICFSRCHRIRKMPTLGRLPCLRKIELGGMNGIECIGHEFYDNRGSDGSQTQTTLFPALKELSIGGMDSLVEWLEAELPSGGTVFPVLEELMILDCPQLRTIPTLGRLPCLRKLNIGGIDGIECIGHEFYDSRGSDGSQTQTTLFPALKELSIRGMGSLVEWLEAKLPCGGIVFPVLQELYIEHCPQLRTIPTLGRLPCLRRLNIWQIHGMQCIGHEFYDSRGSDGSQTQTTLFPALKKLSIGGMDSLVEWLEAELPWGGTVFPVLEELEIQRCPQLRTIPTLGRLPCLRTIGISGINGIECIGHEFYDSRGSDGSQTQTTLFPALKNLWINEMHSLVEWLEAELPRGRGTVFPVLEELRISECPQLRTIPREFPYLKSLLISNIGSTSGQSLVKITSKPNSLRRLRLVNLGSCLDLEELLENNSQSLSVLRISQCQELTRLPDALESLRSLEDLEIVDCPNLTCFPKNITGLTSLRDLEIRGFGGELDSFLFHNNNAEDIRQLVSLRRLSLNDLPKLKTLPHPIQHLPALERLWISKCDGIVELPDWLCNLSSLQELILWHCESLKFLPDAAAIKRLSNLKRLTIEDCPHLKEACSDKSGLEWAKIAHIKYVYIR